MSSNKKNLLRTIFTSNAGCGCSRTKPSDVFQPTAKAKNIINENPNPCPSSSSSCDRNGGFSIDEEASTSTTISESETDPKSSKIPTPCPKIIDSIAVEKDSSDPYQDFRHSMLQMILEKEIYSKDDLRELLDCFLRLNSPWHHHVIIKAFKEIWDEVLSQRLILQEQSSDLGRGKSSRS